MNIPIELTIYIENSILPLYDTFDVAHSRSHADIVIAESLKLSEHYDVNKAMVYTVAAYHDLGLIHGRENHHIDSGKMVASDNILRKWFSDEQIQIIKEAVEDHRASLDNKPRSIYGYIVAEADKDIEPLRILRRTIQFGLKHYPKIPMEKHYERLCDHMSEKYAEGGYLKLWLPESSNAKKLTELRAIIADKEKLYAHFIEIYKEEMV